VTVTELFPFDYAGVLRNSVLRNSLIRLLSCDMVISVKRFHILTGSFLLLLFAIGVILLPTWHKANLGAFSVMLTHGASNEPIKKNNESEVPRSLPRGIFAKPSEAKNAIPPCGNFRGEGHEGQEPQGFPAKEGGKSSRTEHNPATCLICRVAGMAFSSPTPAVIPTIGTLSILGFIHPPNVIEFRVFLALPPVRAPPSAHS